MKQSARLLSNQGRTRLNSGIRFPIDITGVDMRLRHSRCLSTSSIEWHLMEYRDMDYVPETESQMFGKWTN